MRVAPKSLFAYSYGDRLLWEGEWHAVANVTPNNVWLVSLERKDALPFLAESKWSA